MKDVILERMLISAAPERNTKKAFTQNVMAKVRLESSVNEPQVQKSNGLIWRIKHLHGMALAIFIIAAVLAFSGIAYAAIRFLPELLSIDRTQTNSRGETEYLVSDFASCQNVEDAQIQEMTRFVQTSDAPVLTEEEATKILQARCELTMMDSVVRSQWPTRGPKKGETLHAVYYRANGLGTLVSVTEDKVEYYPGPSSERNRTLAGIPGQKIEVFSKTRKTPLESSDLQKGDTIMVIVEVIEDSADKNTPPKETGVKALIRLSLPLEYYNDKQRYIFDAPSCIGNTDESCPSTPSIDVYPAGGESAPDRNLPQPPDTWQHRNISGEVTALSSNSLTLRSFSGNTYKVTLAYNGFSEYNELYTKPYVEQGTDARLRTGSKVEVSYMQPEGADRYNITPQQVMFIKLMLKPNTDYKTKGLSEQY